MLSKEEFDVSVSQYPWGTLSLSSWRLFCLPYPNVASSSLPTPVNRLLMDPVLPSPIQPMPCAEAAGCS